MLMSYGFFQHCSAFIAMENGKVSGQKSTDAYLFELQFLQYHSVFLSLGKWEGFLNKHLRMFSWTGTTFSLCRVYKEYEQQGLQKETKGSGTQKICEHLAALALDFIWVTRSSNQILFIRCKLQLIICVALQIFSPSSCVTGGIFCLCIKLSKTSCASLFPLSVVFHINYMNEAKTNKEPLFSYTN